MVNRPVDFRLASGKNKIFVALGMVILLRAAAPAQPLFSPAEVLNSELTISTALNAEFPIAEYLTPEQVESLIQQPGASLLGQWETCQERNELWVQNFVSIAKVALGASEVGTESVNACLLELAQDSALSAINRRRALRALVPNDPIGASEAAGLIITECSAAESDALLLCGLRTLRECRSSASDQVMVDAAASAHAIVGAGDAVAYPIYREAASLLADRQEFQALATWAQASQLSSERLQHLLALLALSEDQVQQSVVLAALQSMDTSSRSGAIASILAEFRAREVCTMPGLAITANSDPQPRVRLLARMVCQSFGLSVPPSQSPESSLVDSLFESDVD